MAFVNYNNKEITVKIVYYGPALSGKTTCLKYIYESGEYRKKGKLITLDTDGDRTLFFDFLPIEIGKLGDYAIKMQLYTVPGQVAYNTTRKLVLQGADGIVFVADSQVVMREPNVDSLNNLKENLKANNINFEESPLIFQFNKRDLKDVLPIDILNKDLNTENKAFFPTIGTTGENILEGLHTIMKMVIIHLKNKLSIFQKDKTVMFSRDEVTDSVTKKARAPGKKDKAKKEKPRPEPPPVQEDEVFLGNADTEKEEIFELSSSLMDEPLKTRDYPKSDEDIFNLGDSSRMGLADTGAVEPEPVLGDDKRITEQVNAVSNKDTGTDAGSNDASGPGPSEPQPFSDDEDVEEIGAEYQVEQEAVVTASPGSGVDVPIHIEVPEDKDELTINLNLRIMIKKKKD